MKLEVESFKRKETLLIKDYTLLLQVVFHRKKF